MKKISIFMILTLFVGIIVCPLTISYINHDLSNINLEDDWLINENFFNGYINLLMKLAHKSSLSACILIKDSNVWSNGYGFYDIENKKPATTDTIYLTASISKTVTATALMQLYDQGFFDLDDDVNNFLPFNLRNPKFPDVPITFRMILSHRSSLASDNSDRFCCSILPGDPDIPSYPYPWLEEYLTPGGSAFHSSVWSKNPPGKNYYYANIGFSIIGYLVELISGKNFNEYCKDNIFIPLEMYNTSFRLKDLNVSKIAVPYIFNKGEYIANPHYGMILLYPAGSMRTSVEELSHFLIAHMNKGVYKDVRILNESTVELMHTRHYPMHVRGEGYGLGWFITEKLLRKKEIGHSGGWPGVSTQMIYRPDDKTAIIIFTNSNNSEKSSGPIPRLAFKLIINAFFKKANSFTI